MRTSYFGSFRAASFAGSVALGLLTLSTNCFAADSATKGAVRSLAYEGVEAYQAGDYAKAKEKLEVAYSKTPVPSLALWSARALEKNGKLVEAAERYLEATRLPTGDGDAAIQEKAKLDARVEREALLPRIPTLILRVKTSSKVALSVHINGEEYDPALLGVKRPTNPGLLTVVVEQGDARKEEKLTLAEAETKDLELSIEGSAPESVVVAPADGSGSTSEETNSLKPVFVWGGFGLAAVGLGAGAVTGLMTLSQASAIKDDYNCTDAGVCDPGGEQARSDAKTLGLISTISFGVGVLGAGLGIYGLTMSDTTPAPTSAKGFTWNVEVAGLERVLVKGTF